jgi:hypothetical protein
MERESSLVIGERKNLGLLAIRTIINARNAETSQTMKYSIGFK